MDEPLTIPTDQDSLLTWALWYAQRKGWPVFPCVPRGKEPLTKQGFKDASTDPEQIKEWWKRWPSANIGCPTGPQSGHDVVDIEKDGIQTARDKGNQNTWAKYLVATPSGGFHAFVAPRSDVKNAVKPVPGIDIRTTGGYTILPPSFIEYEDGREDWYRWKTMPNGQTLPSMPAWLIEACQQQGRKNARLTSLDLTKGSRDQNLFRYGCRLRAEGFEQIEIEAALRTVNQERCRPPLEAKQIEKIAHQCSAYAQGQARDEAIKAARYEPSQIVDQETGEVKDFNLSDAGNAERMAYLYGADLKFCAQWGKWLVWSGKRWEVANDGAATVYQYAIETVRAIQREALEHSDPDKRKALGQWGFKCEEKKRLDSMVALCAKLPGIPITVDSLDAHPELLNLANGTYNLERHALEPHSRDHLLTAIAPVSYDPEAQCPAWRKFLSRILEDNADLLAYIQRATGCTLDGSKSEKCFFFLYGPGGDNGKSTLVETLHALFGEYARQMPTESLMAKNQEAAVNNDIARLRGARMVAASETQDGRRLNEQLVKQITGDDTISARFLHQEYFEFRPQFMVWMHGNHRPEIRGTDDAIWSRVKLIPFNVRIPKSEQDRSLKVKLKEELPGILLWAIEGHRLWQAEGLGEPEGIAQAVAEYRGSEDRLGAFLDECTVRHESYSVQCGHLYNRYKLWAEANREAIVSQTRFGRQMKERGEGSADFQNIKVYNGRKLKESPADHVYRGSSSD